MPRIPAATFEDFEEPVAASESLALTTPANTTRRAHKAALAVLAFPRTEESNKEDAITPSKRNPHDDDDKKGKASFENNNSGSSLRLSGVQRAAEYPRIAFWPRRELRQRVLANNAEDRAERASHHGRDLVFGVGSHGLRDHSPMHETTQLGKQLDYAKQSTAATTTSAGLPSLPPAEKSAASTVKPKDATMRTKMGQPTVPRLPPIGATAATTAAMMPLRSTKPTLMAPLSQPNAPRELQCGGIIDTFSYFSVHRIHPELYTS
ncbi:hypothetical protein N2W54_001582 [Lotmaria passim]